MTEQKELTENQKAFKKELECYGRLFQFFNQEHDLILTTSEMDDILKACDSFRREWNADIKETLHY